MWSSTHCSSAQIYKANADPSCPVIRNAAIFAPYDPGTPELTNLLNSSLPPSARSSSGAPSYLRCAAVKAMRTTVCKETLLLVFFSFCQKGCPFRTISGATTLEKAEDLKKIVHNSLQKTNTTFYSAWLNESQMVCIEAKLSAQYTLSDLRSALPDSAVQPMRNNTEQDTEENTFQMTVCSLAFLVTKVRISTLTYKLHSHSNQYVTGFVCTTAFIDIKCDAEGSEVITSSTMIASLARAKRRRDTETSPG